MNTLVHVELCISYVNLQYACDANIRISDIVINLEDCELDGMNMNNIHVHSNFTLDSESTDGEQDENNGNCSNRQAKFDRFGLQHDN